MEQKNEWPDQPVSIADVRRRFIAEGISINAWAKARGYKPRTVYAILQGQIECRHGISHEIAVDLGLKVAPAQHLLKLGNA